MAKNPTTKELCDKFCRILNEWLPPQSIAEINRLNDSPEYEGCCATHDFCDPNQAMADALEEFGLHFDPKMCDLINEAWELAKQRGFQAPTHPHDVVPSEAD